MAAPEPRAGPSPRALTPAASQRGPAHRRRAAGLADLPEHPGNEALTPVLRGAGAHAEIVITAPAHDRPAGKSQRARACEAREKRCTGALRVQCAAPRSLQRVPRQPHVQTGFAGGPVPPPFVLPSASTLRSRSGHRRPGGAAFCAARPPANAATAIGRARSRPDACTWGCRAMCGANALALHAQRHRDGVERDRMRNSVMAAAPTTPAAPRRAQWMREPDQNIGCRTTRDCSC